MRKTAIILVAVLLAFVVIMPGWTRGAEEPVPVEEPAEPEAAPVELRFGAMPLGSSWYVYAATITKLLEDVLPGGSSVEVIPHGGGIANPLSVQQGMAEVALANVATSNWAHQGIQMYEGRETPDIRALAGGLNKVFALVIFSDRYIERTGIDTLEELIAQQARARVITKPEGSTAPPVARMMLDQHGITFDTIKEWGGSFTQVDGGQIPALMRDGQADVWFDVVPPGHPAVTEAMLTIDLTMISLGDETIDGLSPYGLPRDIIPADTWPNQPNDVVTVMPGTVIIAHADLPEDVAYQITKIICENKAALVEAHASIEPFVPEEAWKPENTGIPLHPGAERYYRERGWK